MLKIRVSTKKIDPSITEALNKLSKDDLLKLVLYAASKDKDYQNFLLVNIGDTESGEETLYENALNDIYNIMIKRQKGFSEELKMGNSLQECHRRINDFDKVCKNKKLVLDLVMEVLKEVFYNSQISFGTCFTNFDYRVSLLLRKAIDLVINKLHEDYKVDYTEELNHYLMKIKTKAGYFDFVSALPNKIE